MQKFDLARLVAESANADRRWSEFLRVPALSMGLYRINVGQTDEQQPHTEDEVYFIAGGKASFRAGHEVTEVTAGRLIYVERVVEHRFFDITADLTILVFFAPAEGSLKA